MADFPPFKPMVFNQELNGVFGEFGSGAGLQAFYLQSAITPLELDRISLISEIPGSEKWPIRDLFQREVDQDRVRAGLLPYLRDSNKIRFFNPLTLTILPMDTDGRSVVNKMSKVVERDISEDGASWKVLEREGLFQLRWIDGHKEWAQLKWNDSRCRLVAIDGQHRLSALKQMSVDHNAGQPFETFVQWRIPVVFVSFRVQGGRSEPPSVLEVVRSIFVYINTNAQTVNRTRSILLNDEDINAVCTQEVLQYSHENDLKPECDPARRSQAIPLLFYDWRGEERWDPKTRASTRVVSSSAVKEVEEVYDWFEHYLFGKNFSRQQYDTLDVNPTHSLHNAFHDEKLTHQASNSLRKCFREDHLPAFSWLLENFDPYAVYVSRLRGLEHECLLGDNIDRHAFEVLRFGTSAAIDASRDDVSRRLAELRLQIEKERNAVLTSPIDQDIGMRGVVWAYAELGRQFPNTSWIDYAKWFSRGLNKTYKSGWLQFSSKLRSHLKHIAEDHNQTIVNYRLGDAEKALGPHVAILVGAYGIPWPEGSEDQWPEFFEEQIQTLHATLIRGYKKEVRPQLLEEHPIAGKERNDAVRKEAEKRAKVQIRRFRKAVEDLVAR